MRNDKFEVDALVRYGKDRVRAIRKTPTAGELRAPQTLDQLSAYDVVILAGQWSDARRFANGIARSFVKDRSGTVIFSRGGRLKISAVSELEPVLWSEQSRDRVRVDVTSEGRSLAAFRALSDGSAGVDALPDLLNGRNATEAKPSPPRSRRLRVATTPHRRRPSCIGATVAGRCLASESRAVALGLNSKARINAPFDAFGIR